MRIDIGTVMVIPVSLSPTEVRVRIDYIRTEMLLPEKAVPEPVPDNGSGTAER
jgi:hypothetical protein